MTPGTAVYPEPPPVTLIADRPPEPEVMVQTAVACTPPVSFGAEMVTVGAVTYPDPGLVIPIVPTPPIVTRLVPSQLKRPLSGSPIMTLSSLYWAVEMDELENFPTGEMFPSELDVMLTN